MLFKQLQLFKLSEEIPYDADALTNKLEHFEFTPCLPNLPHSLGWTSPVDKDDAPLVHAANGFLMICLKLEEKVLPATVIRQKLDEQIKEIELRDGRKPTSREKLSLKESIHLSLLPVALSKVVRIYAYIDCEKQQLILNNTSAKYTELFCNWFDKTMASSNLLKKHEVTDVSKNLTQWLGTQEYPQQYDIGKICVLKAKNASSRSIRCTEQDLTDNAIQDLLADDLVVKQLALSWNDQVRFVLTDDFLIQRLKFEEELLAESKEMDIESEEQQFDADFIIMTQTLRTFLGDIVGDMIQAKA